MLMQATPGYLGCSHLHKRQDNRKGISWEKGDSVEEEGNSMD